MDYKEDTIAYRICKDEVDLNTPCKTGLTINVIQEVSKKTNVNALVYGAHYIQEYIKGATKVIVERNDTYEPFVRFICEVTKPIEIEGSENEYRVRVYAIANPKTDTLFILTFGSLKSEWSEAWKICPIMFNPIILDDDF